jgi:outer membrane cobalamin receptor
MIGKMIFIKTFFACLTVFSVLARQSLAQIIDSTQLSNKDSSFTELEKVVVTATKSARKISENPASVVVISRKEIQSSAAKNIDDVLQYAVGVQVKRVAGMGEGIPSDIILRGIPGALAATRTLILVDGIPTNVAGTPFLILNEIPLDAIQRVEIIKGPFSSLYGANALGGVINIITIKGNGKPTFSFDGETSFPFTTIDNFSGNNQDQNNNRWKKIFNETYWNGVVQSSGSIGKYDFLVSTGARTIGNYYLSDSAFVRNYMRNSKDTTYYRSIKNHDYTDYRFFLKNGYSFNDSTKLTVHLRYFNSELGFGLASEGDSAEIITKGEKFLIGPYLQFKPFGNVDVSLGGFYRGVTGTYFDRYPVTAEYTKNKDSVVASRFDVCSRDFQLEGRSLIRSGSINSLTIGFDLLWNVIDFGAVSDRITGQPFPGCLSNKKNLSNSGVYLQDELNLFSTTHLVPAVRMDYHSTFGISFSPKLSITENILPKLTARLSAGKAFRAPSATELYMPDTYFGKVYLKSNPSLIPENVVTCDAGILVDLPAGLHLTSDLFHNKLENLITIGDINMSTLRVTHRNISNAWSWGVENELSWKQFQPVSVKLNYSYTRSRNETFLAPLDYIPEHKGNCQVDIFKKIGNGSVTVSMDEGYVGERSCPDWTHPSIIFAGTTIMDPHYVQLSPYWRTDLAVSASFALRYTVSINMQNLFDAKIEESSGSLSPGRFMVVKVKVVF